MSHLSQSHLLGQATAALAALYRQPIRWQPHPKQPPYFHLLIGPHLLTAYLLPHLPPSVAVALTAPSEILLTSYLSAPHAQALREQKQQYLDGAGNAFLRMGDYFILVQGRPRPKQLHIPTLQLPSAWQPVSLRILYYLLSDPALLQAPYRAIAEGAGVALGSVHTCFATARHQGLLREQLRGTRQWGALSTLLSHWVQNYEQVVRPTLGAQRYRWQVAPDSRWRHLPMLSATYWSGEPAAQLLSQERPFAPDSFTLYWAGTLPAWGLVPDPLLGKVEILTPPFPLPRGGSVAPALLVYADLLRQGQRGMAGEVLARCLPHLA